MPQSEQPANSTEGADPIDEIEKKDAGEQNAADAISEDDPHKVEKLSKLGHADDEAAEGTE